jgi:glycosyltransferase involved in cell wall biosynthesis
MCTPSRWEGFGIVFIEAEACESIVITSNIPPMNEYLVNNQNAILIDDYENDQKLASILNNVLNNTEKYSDMRSKARIMAEKFDQGKIDILEADIYDRIIQKGSKNKHCNNLITFYKSWKCL